MSATTFGFLTSGETAQLYTVPSGVDHLAVVVAGAAGAAATSTYAPGYGCEVEATIPVVPGHVLAIYVGGTNDGDTGGDSYEGTAGGGGMTAILDQTANEWLVIAGGGGGTDGSGPGGDGGQVGSAAAGGTFPGGGATQSAGGTNGDGYSGGGPQVAGSPPTFYRGGSAMSGGGGGYYTGGAGGGYWESDTLTGYTATSVNTFVDPMGDESSTGYPPTTTSGSKASGQTVTTTPVDEVFNGGMYFWNLQTTTTDWSPDYSYSSGYYSGPGGGGSSYVISLASLVTYTAGANASDGYVQIVGLGTPIVMMV